MGTSGILIRKHKYPPKHCKSDLVGTFLPIFAQKVLVQGKDTQHYFV